MFKVICIVDKNPETINAICNVKEGEIYEVYDSSIPDYYFVSGLEYCPVLGTHDIYHKRRFIPLSDLDERTIQKQRELDAIINEYWFQD